LQCIQTASIYYRFIVTEQIKIILLIYIGLHRVSVTGVDLGCVGWRINVEQSTRASSPI
jgi:hypothetical protein